MTKPFNSNYLAAISFFLVFPFFLQAQKVPVSKKHNNGETININLYDANKNAKTYPLSTIAVSIKYIPLETTKDCLIGDYLTNIFVNSDGIFVFDYSHVYHFSINGKFIGKIGKVGRGPGEYNQAMSISVDTLMKNIYFLDTDRLVKYDYDGNFIKEYQLGIKSMKLLEYKEGVFLIDDEFYQFAEPGKRFSIHFYSEAEEKQIAKVDCPKKDKIPFSISFPIMYKFNRNTFLKDYWDNTIYQVEDPENLNTYALINMGKFKNRDQDDKFVITGKKNKGEELVLGIDKISESDHFIFMLANQGLFFYDKNSKETQCCEFSNKGEKWYTFENDLTGGPTLFANNFPLHVVDNNTFVTFNHAYEFFEDGVDANNSQIKKVMQNLQVDDNPVLVLVKMKE